MNKINVQCPQCGANIKIKVPVVTAIVTPTSEIPEVTEVPVKKLNDAEAKIEALREAGVDVENLFSIRGTNGTYEVGRLSDGRFSVVPEDDPIFKAIKASRTIPDRRLFRRWVMAQVFHMMTEVNYKTDELIGFTAALHRKGYKYQWEMVIEELRVQAKLFDNDPENYMERNRWFNREVVVQMAMDYIKLVKTIVEKLRIRRCKGVPYVRLGHTDIFIADLETKVYAPLEKRVVSLRHTRNSSSLYKATVNFYQAVKRTCLFHDMEQSKAFTDAYKGAGAFYTLKNLILFHNCVFPNMDQKASIAYLNYLVDGNEFPGYKLFGVLKEFLATNNIDIKAKQREWRK